MSSESHNTTKLSSKTKRWMIIAIAISAIGIAISFYSTNHHLQLKQDGFTDAACNINQTFSCDDVAKSKYSEIFGLPLGVFGLGYFFSLAILALVALTSVTQRKAHLQTYTTMVGLGVLVSLSLAGISAFDLGFFCVTCIGVYLTTLAQAGVLFAFRNEIPKGIRPRSLLNGGTTAAISVAAVMGLFSLITPNSPVSGNSSSSSSNTHTDSDGHGHSSSLEVSGEVSEITINKSAYSGLGEDYRAGNDSAKVIIVEFADFECPACRNMAQIMKTIKSEYGQKILMVFKNYPLDQKCNPSIQRAFHQSACTIAILSRCSGMFGKFWQYHDLAYAEQKNASEDQAKLWAKQVGLSNPQIETCLKDKSIIDKLHDDIKIADSIGLTGTPTVFINGRKLLGNTGIDSIRTQIDKALSKN